MLEVRDLHLHDGASHALEGISLTLERGKITCLMGRNGVGKTTLSRGILGHERITSGTVLLAGTPIEGLPAWKRARLGLAAVPQGREIFPRLTVEESLATGYAALRGRGVEPLPLAEIDARFPVLERMAGRRGGDLSGGRQQQAIGRALVTRPHVLLLDEPTEGIQPDIVAELGRVVDRGRIVLGGDRASLDLKAARRHLTVRPRVHRPPIESAGRERAAAPRGRRPRRALAPAPRACAGSGAAGWGWSSKSRSSPSTPSTRWADRSSRRSAPTSP